MFMANLAFQIGMGWLPGEWDTSKTIFGKKK